MNKILTSLLVASSAFAFAACVGEQDDIFDKSAAERLNEVSEIYTNRLAASQGGWLMEYYPTNDNERYTGEGYVMAMRFTSDNKVLVGMKNFVTFDEYKECESAWEVITDNGPVLSFNTYNDVLHTFSAPNDNPFTKGKYEDETGRGFEGDYEFVITNLDEDADRAMLKGKKRGTYNRITRLPAGTDFETILTDIADFKTKMIPNRAHEIRLDVGGKTYSSLGMDTIPNIFPSDGDAVIDINMVPYTIGKRGDKYTLRFHHAIGEGDDKEQCFVYDESRNMFVGEENSANVVRGYNAAELPKFFVDVLDLKGWMPLTTDESSAEFVDLYKRAEEGFKAKSSLNTLQSIAIKNVGDKTHLIFTYKKSRTSGLTLKYIYGRTETDKGVTLTYEKPLNSDATKMADADGVQQLIEMFNGALTVTDADPRGLCVKSVKVTCANGVWFRTNYAF